MFCFCSSLSCSLFITFTLCSVSGFVRLFVLFSVGTVFMRVASGLLLPFIQSFEFNLLCRCRRRRCCRHKPRLQNETEQKFSVDVPQQIYMVEYFRFFLSRTLPFSGLCVGVPRFRPTQPFYAQCCCCRTIINVASL